MAKLTPEIFPLKDESQVVIRSFEPTEWDLANHFAGILFFDDNDRTSEHFIHGESEVPAAVRYVEDGYSRGKVCVTI